MMTTYVVNAFSANMVTPPVNVEFGQVGKEEFCGAIAGGINAIGHAGTIDLINELCGTNLQVNRAGIKAKVGDTVYIVMLTVRLEEGKVLKADEVRRMYDDGKVVLMKAMIHNLTNKAKEGE